MKIHGIVAVDQDYGIGKNNKIPWYYKKDLIHFRNLTINNTIVMGSKTFDSIGKILDKRKHIIFTRNKKKYKELISENFIVVSNIFEFMKLKFDVDIYIIGGSEIFELTKNYIDIFHITYIDKSYNCDVFFNKKILLDFYEYNIKYDNPLTFITYRRKNNN